MTQSLDFRVRTVTPVPQIHALPLGRYQEVIETGPVGRIVLREIRDVVAGPVFNRARSPLGEQLRLSFRLYLHDGDAEAAHVDDQYRAFVIPLRMEEC